MRLFFRKSGPRDRGGVLPNALPAFGKKKYPIFLPGEGDRLKPSTQSHLQAREIGSKTGGMLERDEAMLEKWESSVEEGDPPPPPPTPNP